MTSSTHTASISTADNARLSEASEYYRNSHTQTPLLTRILMYRYMLCFQF